MATDLTMARNKDTDVREQAHSMPPSSEARDRGSPLRRPGGEDVFL